MRKVFAIVALALSLGACANVRNAYDVLTGAKVNPAAVYVERNAADVLIRSATNYLVLCHKNPTNIACNKAAEGQVVQATRAVRLARNNITIFMQSHPDAIGAGGLYDALKQAVDSLKSVMSIYNIEVAS